MSEFSSSPLARALVWSPVVGVPVLIAVSVYMILQNRALSVEVDLLARDVAAMHAQVVETREAVGRINADGAARRASKLAKQARMNQRKAEGERSPEEIAERQERRRARSEAQGEGQPRRKRGSGETRRPEGERKVASGGKKGKRRKGKGKGKRRGRGQGQGGQGAQPAAGGAQVIEG
jgi:hypothetical protein